MDAERQRLYAPYHVIRGRFAFLDRAVARFRAGQQLTDLQARSILGIMATWAQWYAETAEQRRFARRLESRSGTSARMLATYYDQLSAMGFCF